MKLKFSSLLLILLLVVFSLIMAGCSPSDGLDNQDTEDKVITIGATEEPHGRILEKAKDILAEDGYTLDIKLYGDYDGMNRDVFEGNLDANYFQHITYLNEYNILNGTDLVNAGAIHFEPLAMYSGEIEDISDLKEGMTIVIPSEPTNEARALRLLESAEVITLKEDADVLATTDDISENPMNIKFVEVEGYETVDDLEEVDAAVINGNYAIKADLDYKDAVLVEGTDSMLIESYANVIAVKSGNEALPKIEALYGALTSQEIKSFIEEEYKGAAVTVY